jgi:hypothetical protein
MSSASGDGHPPCVAVRCHLGPRIRRTPGRSIGSTPRYHIYLSASHSLARLVWVKADSRQSPQCACQPAVASSVPMALACRHRRCPTAGRHQTNVLDIEPTTGGAQRNFLDFRLNAVE